MISWISWGTDFFLKPKVLHQTYTREVANLSRHITCSLNCCSLTKYICKKQPRMKNVCVFMLPAPRTLNYLLAECLFLGYSQSQPLLNTWPVVHWCQTLWVSLFGYFPPTCLLFDILMGKQSLVYVLWTFKISKNSWERTSGLLWLSNMLLTWLGVKNIDCDWICEK